MHSIRNRVLLALIVIGMTPYFFVLIYFSYWERNAIIASIKSDYRQEALHAKKMIENTLVAIEEEISFIAKLEVFDEMLSSDIDFQIARLLEQKSMQAGEKHLRLFAIDLNRTIVASSEAYSVEQLAMGETLTKRRFVHDDSILFIQPLFASFNQKKLGYLVAKYPITKIKRFLTHDAKVDFRIVKSASQEAVKLEGVLEGYSIAYTINEALALKRVEDFLLYLLGISVIGAILIILISRKMSSMMSQPITQLQAYTQDIIATKDFSQRLKTSSIAEFDALSRSFNTLFSSVEALLETLANENEMRLRNYIALSDTFGSISASNMPKEAMQLTQDALQKHLKCRVDLSTESTDSKSARAIRAYDYIVEEIQTLGYFSIDPQKGLDDLELIFVESVLLMLQKQLERNSLLAKIDAASSAKSDFISALSHELRSPLNAIIGYSQYMISYEALSDEQMDTLSKVEKAAYHLLDIINDILDIAKIEAGKIAIKSEKMMLNEEIKECVEILEALVEDKGLELRVDLRASNNLIIENDRKIVRQIVINLISNAIKFTHEGYISVHSSYHNNKLVIAVEDSGTGISKEDLQTIFDEFTQLKNANSSTKGSGLGLALSKQLSNAIGGELVISSQGVGKGATAYLSFNL